MYLLVLLRRSSVFLLEDQLIIYLLLDVVHRLEHIEVLTRESLMGYQVHIILQFFLFIHLSKYI